MRRIVAFACAGLVLVLLVLAQLLLPGIAADHLRDQLRRSGTVLSVQVHAFPAIELLWHHADKVVIRMADYRSTTGTLGGMLGQAGDVGSLDASATVVTAGLLTLHDATLHKRGEQLSGHAVVQESDLEAAVPFLASVEPVTSGGGQLTLRGTASALGLSATADATVEARDGALVVVPDLPLLPAVTVFSNPHVRVQGVSATAAPGGFAVSAEARAS